MFYTGLAGLALMAPLLPWIWASPASLTHWALLLGVALFGRLVGVVRLGLRLVGLDRRVSHLRVGLDGGRSRGDAGLRRHVRSVNHGREPC